MQWGGQLNAQLLATLFATNVSGSFICAREAVKRMAFCHGGQGGAIDTLTIGLSLEIAAQGIRVNAVRPGFIYTDMHTDGREAARVDRVKDSLLMKRGGQTGRSGSGHSMVIIR